MNMIGKSAAPARRTAAGCDISIPGSDRYAAATAIWAKPVGPMPRAIVHCRTAADVQSAIRAARDADLALSVRGGGHDWAGRALCDGLVIDLSAMNGTVIAADNRSARIAGGASASDVLGVTDPHGLAAVTGSCGAVGMAGFTLGGGYGPCIGRFGLALDNLLAAEVVLADGRIVTASDSSEAELFWALRGGGGNFGVVTAMQHRLHELPCIWSGMLLFPFAEARSVLEGCAEIAASAPEELTVQLGILVGPDGAPMVMIVPTWCGPPEQGEARVAPFLKLGTVLVSTVAAMSCRDRLGIFAPHIVNGQRVFMETSWLPSIDSRSVDAMIHAMAGAVSPGCAILPTPSGAPRRAFPWRPPPSAFAAITCLSRLLPPSPIDRTASRSSGTGNGRGPRARPSIRWRFRAVTQTSSQGVTGIALRKPTVVTPSG